MEHRRSTFVGDYVGFIADLAATDSDEDGISNLEDDDADNDGGFLMSLTLMLVLMMV